MRDPRSHSDSVRDSLRAIAEMSRASIQPELAEGNHRNVNMIAGIIEILL